MLLCSVIGLADPASTAVPTMGLVFSQGFTHVFTNAKPFKAADSNTLSIILANALSFIYIAALLIKMDTSAESDQDQMLFTTFLLVVLLVGPAAIAFQLIKSELGSRCDAVCGKKVVEEVISAEDAEKRYKKSLKKVKAASLVGGWLGSGTDRKLVDGSDSDDDSVAGMLGGGGGGSNLLQLEAAAATKIQSAARRGSAKAVVQTKRDEAAAAAAAQAALPKKRPSPRKASEKASVRKTSANKGAPVLKSRSTSNVPAIEEI